MSSHRKRVLIATLCLACFSAGCSGQTSAPVTPAQRTDEASVHFVMHWPARHSMTEGRRPLFISPSTLSVSVEVNDDPALTTIVNNPSQNGSAAVGTVALMAPPGSDTFTFALWDQPNATGNELGQASVTQSISSGAANTLNATVDGLATFIQFAPLPNQAQVTASVDSQGNTSYDISGDLATTFSATALDADHNVIVGNGNPLTYSIQAVDPSLSVAPVNGQPNEFVIQAVSAPAATAHPGVSVTVRDGAGTIVTANTPIALSPLLYVAYENAGQGSIAALNQQGQAVPLPGKFPGMSDPRAITYDGSNHRIYVADHAAGALLAYNTDGTPVSGFPNVTVAAIAGVTFDPHNSQLYVVSGSNTASSYTADGAPVSLAGSFTRLSGPTGITYYDPMKALIVANNVGRSLTIYNEDGSSSAFRQPIPHGLETTGAFSPFGIGASSDLIVATEANGSTYTLNHISVGTGSSLQSTSDSLNGPAGVVVDGFDTIYVANALSGTVTIYPSTLGSASATYPAPSGFSAPSGIAVVF